jgi:hypothetical protein
MKWAQSKSELLQVKDDHASILNIIHISNVGQYTLNDQQLATLVQELKTRRLQVRYNRGDVWAKRMKDEKGWDEERIKKCRIYESKGTLAIYKSSVSNDMNECIRRTAHDHSFLFERTNKNKEVVKSVTYTVADYYSQEKGLPLKYPNLPIVRVSDDEWIPIEFLLQGKFLCSKYTCPLYLLL